jgi:hypothetical protein
MDRIIFGTSDFANRTFNTIVKLFQIILNKGLEYYRGQVLTDFLAKPKDFGVSMKLPNSRKKKDPINAIHITYRPAIENVDNPPQYAILDFESVVNGEPSNLADFRPEYEIDWHLRYNLRQVDEKFDTAEG